MAAQERAGRRGCLEALSYSCPRCITMLADVVTGDLVRDTLVAKVQKQPIEQPRCVAPSDSGLDSFLPQTLSKIVKKRQTQLDRRPA